MGMASVFIRSVGLRWFNQNICCGTNAHRHVENSVTYREQSTSVRMAYSVYGKEEPGHPVLIMHGLMGSRKNWNAISKAINSTIKRKVIAVDARNHGDSAHSRDMTYRHMAEDLRLFIDEHKLGRVIPLGHSMGGKAVMVLALMHPELVEKLVVVDTSPKTSSPSFSSVLSYLVVLQQIKFADNMSMPDARKLVDQKLASIVKSPVVRQFLAANLTQAENGKIKWRVNLDTLVDTFGEIAAFPATEKTFVGPAYFIAGGVSDYIRSEDEPEIRKFFPSATFKYIPGAGHWVHADKPNVFVDEVCKFITGQ